MSRRVSAANEKANATIGHGAVSRRVSAANEKANATMGVVR